MSVGLFVLAGVVWPVLYLLFLLAILITAIIMLAPGLWIYVVATRRGDQKAPGWAVFAFLAGITSVLGGYMIAIIYYAVRDNPENWRWVIVGRLVLSSFLSLTGGVLVCWEYSNHQNALSGTLAGVSQLLLFLTLILILFSTVAFHYDRQYAITNYEWGPSKLYYLMGSPDGIISTLVAIIYLYERHQHIGLP